ncbi:hypothetical protein EWM64_g3295 [Hericium alpestre]|uniref:Uncharacterized protein n=1 Tax=Hericium alpestre TaxID=135208 RepID=A0A4Z0A203_9AGAM|nr:hypothetical protein EWM64_g3295 [Hericium alpestre]
MVIPKHFVPPLVVNAVLGTVLWTSYAEASSLLEPHMAAYPIVNAALSGAIAGGCQAIIAAPAENLRLAIEGGSAKSGGWSHAWKEVFRGTAPARSDLNINVRNANLEDIRQIRTWMRDVRDMAGRGWDGWGWGLAKDMFGMDLPRL